MLAQYDVIDHMACSRTQEVTALKSLQLTGADPLVEVIVSVCGDLEALGEVHPLQVAPVTGPVVVKRLAVEVRLGLAGLLALLHGGQVQGAAVIARDVAAGDGGGPLAFLRVRGCKCSGHNGFTHKHAANLGALLQVKQLYALLNIFQMYL